MKKIYLILVLLFISLITMGQVKKVVIKTNSVQYGTQVKYKGMDVWNMDGAAIPTGLLFVIKDNTFSTVYEDGKKTNHSFKEETEFRDDYTEITFTLICADGYEYHVKIDRVKCCIEFVYHNGVDWRLSRYVMEAILFKQ